MSTQLLSDHLADALNIAHSNATLGVHVSEANHRIANNLTLIAGMLRLQANDIAKAERVFGPDEVKLLLAEVGARIETVGRLHSLLARGGASTCLDVTGYLQDIAEAAIEAMSVSDVVLAAPSQSVCELPAQIALSVGFIVGEAVTNAVKYAHPAGAPGKIGLDCQRRSDGSTLILVSDDGVGLPEGFDAIHDGGLGLRIMRTISKQLGADLTFTAHGAGLTVSLLLPPNRPVSTTP